MTGEISAVPTTFRGLRILLLDNDTATLLDISAKLENCSYKGKFLAFFLLLFLPFLSISSL